MGKADRLRVWWGDRWGNRSRNEFWASNRLGHYSRKPPNYISARTLLTTTIYLVEENDRRRAERKRLGRTTSSAVDAELAHTLSGRVRWTTGVNAAG